MGEGDECCYTWGVRRNTLIPGLSRRRLLGHFSRQAHQTFTQDLTVFLPGALRFPPDTVVALTVVSYKKCIAETENP